MGSKLRRTKERHTARTRKTPQSLAALQAQARKHGTDRLSRRAIESEIGAARRTPTGSKL